MFNVLFLYVFVTIVSGFILCSFLFNLKVIAYFDVVSTEKRGNFLNDYYNKRTTDSHSRF